MINEHNGLNYSLIRSDRKTMSIYVDPDGDVSVRAPKELELEKINNILDLRSFWITKSVIEFEELNKAKTNRTIVDGEGFLYMGRSYRLKIVTQSKEPLTFNNGYFLLDERYVKSAKKLFINFYKDKAKEYITTRVDYFKDKLGVIPKNTRVMDLKNRWGSLGKDSVNFHWRVILAPIGVIDYIIVHELAHMIIRNHNAEFWQMVESVMPNYKDRKNWLRLNGAGLDI